MCNNQSWIAQSFRASSPGKLPGNGRAVVDDQSVELRRLPLQVGRTVLARCKTERNESRYSYVERIMTVITSAALILLISLLPIPPPPLQSSERLRLLPKPPPFGKPLRRAPGHCQGKYRNALLCPQCWEAKSSWKMVCDVNQATEPVVELEMQLWGQGKSRKRNAECEASAIFGSLPNLPNRARHPSFRLRRRVSYFPWCNSSLGHL